MSDVLFPITLPIVIVVSLLVMASWYWLKIKRPLSKGTLMGIVAVALTAIFGSWMLRGRYIWWGPLGVGAEMIMIMLWLEYVGQTMRSRSALEERARQLAASLSQAADIAEVLQEEIRARQKALERVELQSEVAQRILSELSEEEIAAVAAAIAARDWRRRVIEIGLSFLVGLLTNVFTAILFGH